MKLAASFASFGKMVKYQFYNVSLFLLCSLAISNSAEITSSEEEGCLEYDTPFPMSQLPVL